MDIANKELACLRKECINLVLLDLKIKEKMPNRTGDYVIPFQDLMAVGDRKRVHQIWAEQIQIHIESMGLMASFDLEERQFVLNINESHCEVVNNFLFIGNRAHRLH